MFNHTCRSQLDRATFCMLSTTQCFLLNRIRCTEYVCACVHLHKNWNYIILILFHLIFPSFSDLWNIDSKRRKNNIASSGFAFVLGVCCLVGVCMNHRGAILVNGIDAFILFIFFRRKTTLKFYLLCDSIFLYLLVLIQRVSLPVICHTN